FWDDKDPRPISAGPLLRLMSGFDPSALAGAADGLTLTLSLTPRGALRDVAGLGEMVAALAESFGDFVSADDLGWMDREWREEIAKIVVEMENTDLPEQFSFLLGLLPEEPVTMDSMFTLGEGDFLALFGNGESAGEGGGEADPPFKIRWNITPLGARPEVVVFALTLLGGLDQEAYLSGAFSGEGELEMEAATGLPRRLRFSLDWDFDILEESWLEMGDYSFPITFTASLEPL
ncbi:hypothetical protein IIA16_02740, partial [bacterium]|nr:hypothetical protein [bacterium]